MVGLFPGGNPFAVMYVMLVKALQAQCTPEQYEDFGKRLERFEICGTYAQTELGHGTYLRGLETRADFDPKTDEFVLNTPKISSYKFWPGGCKYFSLHSIHSNEISYLYIISGSQLQLLLGDGPTVYRQQVQGTAHVLHPGAR